MNLDNIDHTEIIHSGKCHSQNDMEPHCIGGIESNFMIEARKNKSAKTSF